MECVGIGRALRASGVTSRVLSVSPEPRDEVVLGQCHSPFPRFIPVVSCGTPAVRPAKRDPAFSVAFAERLHRGLGLQGERLDDRLARMRQNPIHFFRALPSLFVEDVLGEYAATARLLPRPAPEQAVAIDVHLNNFGIYRGPDGQPVWGLNDFDQADHGTPELDLGRLATSLALQGRKAGLDAEERSQVLHAAVRAYCEQLGEASPGSYLAFQETTGPVQALFGQVEQDRWRFVRDMIERTPDGMVFKRNDEVRDATPEAVAAVRAGLDEYAGRLPADTPLRRPLMVLDVAEKWGSGGSTRGLPRYYALVVAEEPSASPYVLEIKQLLASPLVDRTGDLSRADAQAAVARQRDLGGYHNGLTGHAGHGWLVREREPEKLDLGNSDMNSLEELLEVAAQAGRVLARAHAPTPESSQSLRDWVGPDADLLERNLGTFGESYADQVAADWEAFRAVTAGLTTRPVVERF
ncbi:MAG: DUF2252 family protein [Candidatus Eremiobacterota bacterium]